MADWIDAFKTPPPKDQRVLGCTGEGWIFIGKNWEVGDEINEAPFGVHFWAPLPDLPEAIKHELLR